MNDERNQPGFNDVELVDDLYLVIVEPERYDDLVQKWHMQISKAIGRSHEESSALDPHMARAAELISRRSKIQSGTSRLPEDHLQTQPRLIVSTGGAIEHCNRAAERAYSVRAGDTLSDLPFYQNMLELLQKAVSGLARTDRRGGEELPLIRGVRIDSGQSVLVLLEPTVGEEPFVTLRTTDMVWPLELSPVLRSAFQLTSAEVEVARLMVEGKTVADVAQVRSSSVATVRTQLKSIFSKTETNSQAEFVRIVLGMGQLFVESPAHSPDTHGSVGPCSRPAENQRLSLVLNDGRTLAYADFGDPAGRVCLYFHDNITGDTWPEPMADAAAARGIRIIAPARPLFGKSSELPAGADAVPTVVLDTITLLDHLRISEVVLVSRTTGSYFAAALAAEIPERVNGIVAIAPALPFKTEQDVARMPDHGRLLVRSARFSRAIMRYLTAAGHAYYKAFGARRYLQMIFRNSPPDLEVLAEPAFQDAIELGCRFAGAHGQRAFLQEIRAVSSTRENWLKRGKVPTNLLIGEEDRNGRLQRAIAQTKGNNLVRVTPVAGAGALLFYSHPEQVVGAIDAMMVEHAGHVR